MEIAGYTRYLEVTGLSISLAALVLSLFIFFYFRYFDDDDDENMFAYNFLIGCNYTF